MATRTVAARPRRSKKGPRKAAKTNAKPGNGAAGKPEPVAQAEAEPETPETRLKTLCDALPWLFCDYHDLPTTPLPDLALSALADDAEILFEAFNGAVGEHPDVVQRCLWRMEQRARMVLVLHEQIQAANQEPQS